jgi:hypothetical protein
MKATISEFQDLAHAIVYMGLNVVVGPCRFYNSQGFTKTG